MTEQNPLYGNQQELFQRLAENKALFSNSWISSATNSNILCLKKNNNPQKSLFFFPATDGSVSYFHHLAPYLPEEKAFYGMQTPGLHGEQLPYKTIEEIAAHNLLELKKIQPEGPYYIGGYCMGGLPSYELACQLQAAGDEVIELIHLMPIYLREWESLANEEDLHMRAIKDYVFLSEMLLKVKMPLDYERLRDLDEIGRIEEIVSFAKNNGCLTPDVSVETIQRRLSIYQTNLNAMLQYKPKRVFNGGIKIISVGQSCKGEIELDYQSCYTAHLCVIDRKHIDTYYVDADPTALLNGEKQELDKIGKAFLEHMSL